MHGNLKEDVQNKEILFLKIMFELFMYYLKNEQECFISI